MDEGRHRTTETGPSTTSPSESPGPDWDRQQSALDEAEVQSFPASDPQSSWAGSDRGRLPGWDDEQ
ncbi:MAG TPA: hypothetical protein VHU17_19730 [Acidimicrobiales bacterium]|jgi:hypothetical protein|nr:hypothetical protein [Acidimicrobiales bacterium]